MRLTVRKICNAAQYKANVHFTENHLTRMLATYHRRLVVANDNTSVINHDKCNAMDPMDNIYV